MAKMSGYSKLIVILSAAFFFFAGTVRAEEVSNISPTPSGNPSSVNQIVEAGDSTTGISPDKAKSDPTGNSSGNLPPVQTDQIVPMPPTPSPNKLISPLAENKEEDSQDKRSWTRFKYNDIIKSISDKYKIDPQVIYATIMTESEGNEYAYRFEPHLNDASLCMGQILISTARTLGFTDSPEKMYKPDVCIELIGKYHRKMLDTFGDLTPVQLATAYNAGSPWKRPVYGHISRFTMWYNEI